MVTKAKPKHPQGAGMKRALSEVDGALGYDDYKSIMGRVPSITRGALPWLQHKIRAAAAWYVIEAKIDADAKPAEDKAAFMKLAKHLGEVCKMLVKLDPTARIRLAEQAISEESKKALVEREAALLGQEHNLPEEVIDSMRPPDYALTPAMRSPIERENLIWLARLSRWARKAANSLDTGRQPRKDFGLAILMEAWPDATGRSVHSDKCEKFLVFARELTRTLRGHKFDVKSPSRRQMDNVDAYFKRAE